MEWLATLATGLGLLLLLSPLLLLLLTVFVLVPLAHLQPPPPMLSRVGFGCPFSRQPVDVAFLTLPGSDRPLDVLSCSMYRDGPIRCQRDCLGLANCHTAPAPMVARYALLAGGEVYREPLLRSPSIDGREPDVRTPRAA